MKCLIRFSRCLEIGACFHRHGRGQAALIMAVVLLGALTQVGCRDCYEPPPQPYYCQPAYAPACQPQCQPAASQCQPVASGSYLQPSTTYTPPATNRPALPAR